MNIFEKILDKIFETKQDFLNLKDSYIDQVEAKDKEGYYYWLNIYSVENFYCDEKICIDPENIFHIWMLFLDPDFCKVVFGDKKIYFCENCHNFVNDEIDLWCDGDITIGCKFCQDEGFYQNIRYLKKWENDQEYMLEMRNKNKTIDEVLEYIEQNTILDLKRVVYVENPKNPTDVVGKINWTETE